MVRPRALLSQILAVNAVLILGAVLAATVVAHLDVDDVGDRRQIAVLGAAILATVLVNGVVLRRRLAPLDDLIAAMETVDLTSPADHRALARADSTDVARLQLAFERMLTRLQLERADAGRAVLRAQEDERARLARDLHDEANQALTGVLLRLGATAAHAPPALAAELKETQAVATQAMQELLGLARELRPSALDDHGLRAALRSQVQRFGDQERLRASLATAADLDQALEADQQLVVYRVVQEALSNVARHARASTVRVDARRRAGHVVVQVADDGVGFDPGRTPAGLGRTGMRERALLAGGRLAVRSAPGEGTVVELVLDGQAPPSVAPPARPGGLTLPPLPARRVEVVG